MSDLIDRRSAIDALNKYFARIGRLKRRGLTKGEKAISLDTVGTIKTLPPIQPEIIYCKDCSKHNVSISKAPYPFKEYICPLIAFRGEAQGHEFDYQFCAYGKRREVTNGN